MHALWRFIKGSGVALFETPFLGFYEEVPLLRRWNYRLEFHEKALFLRQRNHPFDFYEKSSLLGRWNHQFRCFGS